MPDPYVHMRFSPGARRAADVLALALAGAILVLVGYGTLGQQGPAWDLAALLRAFARFEDGTPSLGPLGVGLVNTLRLSLWSLPAAGLVGLALGLLRVSPVRARRFTSGRLVELFRNLPPLVLVFIVHYFLTGALAAAVDWSGPAATPVLSVLLPGAPHMPAFVSAVLTLGLYEGAYVAEIVRAGIAGVPVGQWEAADALGLPRRVVLRRVVLPQAVRFMVPPLTGQTASLIKDSAIMSVISVQELTFQGMEFCASGGLVGETWTGVALCYLLLCLGISWLGRRWERRLERHFHS